MKPLRIAATANANLQNTINISIIFNHIRDQGPLYRAQIVKDLGLSAPAVSRAVDYLRQEGYLIESERRAPKSGKLTTWYEINPQKGYVIGIDFITDPVKLAVFDYAGNHVDELRGFRLASHPELRRELVTAIKRLMERQGTAQTFRAISFGVPAVIGPTGRVENAVLYEDLQGKNLKELLEPIFGIPVFVENTANLSALAESHFGKGRSAHSFIFIEVGNGIGAGIVHEGSLLRGHTGAAGEIGYAVPGQSESSVEGGASLPAIRQAGRGLVRRDPSCRLAELVGGDPERVEANTVCTAASTGCTESARIIQEVVSLLSGIVYHAVLLLDPELIVLGGDMCELPAVDELIVGPLRERVERALPFAKPRIELSAIGNNADVLGAATFALESLLLGLYPYKLQN